MGGRNEARIYNERILPMPTVLHSRHSIRRALPAISFGLACSLALATLGPIAHADVKHDLDSDKIAQALSNVNQIDESFISSSSASPEDALNPVNIGGGTITLPHNASQPINLTGPDGDKIDITLPASESAQDAEVLGDGTVAYPGDSAASAAITTDRGLQLISTIRDAKSPTRYAYDFNLTSGQHLETFEDGAIITDDHGTANIAVGAAWAVDANGKTVPTHYEISGSQLIQIVDHTSVTDVAYPVVADPIVLAPWMVKCLVGIGLKGPDIARIAMRGTYWSILAAFGRGAVACVFGK